MYDKMQNEATKYSKEIKNMAKNIIEEANSIEALNTIKYIFSYLKTISHQFYNESNKAMDSAFRILMLQTYDIYTKLSLNWYITPERYNYNKNYIIPNNIYDCSEEEILKFITHETYKEFLTSVETYSYKFEDIDFTNKCYMLSYLFKCQCKKYNIQCSIIKINPAFSKNFHLFNGSRFHFFNIASFDKNSYLVDCSYRQFFITRRNIIESLGVPEFCPPDPGSYMLMDTKRREVAKKILTDSFILLTSNNLKDYLDGFTLSFRNGLYYEQNNDTTYKTPYKYSDYLNFLYTDASQLDYEDSSQLGYQQQPLDNPKFVFTKKNIK